jgi:hypothetical protein
MDAKALYKKAIGFHKETFEKTYTYVTKLQDQFEQKATAFIDGAAFVPDPAKEFYRQWTETAKNSRDALKKYADEGYQGIEDYLATTA